MIIVLGLMHLIFLFVTRAADSSDIKLLSLAVQLSLLILQGYFLFKKTE